MQLLDTYLPTWSIREVDRVAVAADAERAHRWACGVDLFRIRPLRALFALRALPHRMAAWRRGRRAPLPRSARIDGLSAAGAGFRVLAEERDREVVVGTVGKPWKLTRDLLEVGPDEFAGFVHPGWSKVALSVRADPRVGGGAWLTVEVRADTTDDRSLARLRRYWKVVGRLARAARRVALARAVADLGAAPGDERRSLAGDELLPGASFHRTHAVTIDAPRGHVWPWLMQMGCGRAGWYSYDLFDHAGVPSAARVLDRLQDLAVGDRIWALPDRRGELAVLRLDPGSALVLGSPALAGDGAAPDDGPPWLATWSFVLDSIGPSATRLVARVRADLDPGVRSTVLRPVMATVHELMERRQLRNLRRRVERHEVAP